MKKLINLQVNPVSNVICGYRTFSEDGIDDCDFTCGIACDDAARGFMIPSYMIVGVFDDGSAIASGIMSLTDINPIYSECDDIEGYYERLFMYRCFLDYVSEEAAQAFVRGELHERSINEKEAREYIYTQMQKAGVTMSEGAVKYLTGNSNSLG